MSYSETTRSIQVTVEPRFLEDQSQPENHHYVWAYQVRIENHGAEAVQLLNRYWRITNANGLTQEVEGPGVVGEQPHLAPGESFVYTSGCPLPTASGIMQGRYEMQSDRGERFWIAIPAFSLDSPHEAVRIN
ncbi:Co2+/Mg2+ efflux protein ApaG [Aquibaculum arenosum]|uniref:Protein ApaG n=1 Tax=Aquibaculum arenosum TaxID=3032591 RepID=A0ABT5YS77_9PROT|nr:Co2+/Mg2+ efflux protein ApaG [Fodinicurvata sp. CAU 1616]MDF2097089.1 Co2+/Mg2+ efflux protein ApaG [Fodinicurvata sp. CAU 1616]